MFAYEKDSIGINLNEGFAEIVIARSISRMSMAILACWLVGTGKSSILC